MSLIQIIVWIVVGAIAGLLADAVVRGIGVGLLGAILVGIVGAFVGTDFSLWYHHGNNIIIDILWPVGAVIVLSSFAPWKNNPGCAVCSSSPCASSIPDTVVAYTRHRKEAGPKGPAVLGRANDLNETT